MNELVGGGGEEVRDMAASRRRLGNGRRKRKASASASASANANANAVCRRDQRRHIDPTPVTEGSIMVNLRVEEDQSQHSIRKYSQWHQWA
ncbi:hypothetical protein BCON_0053g00080 [Botryotinia convoluta]|uniref:Uncharacterized protein n=1 Tax=Botryotinia convoluta TaxID=54673 RepID=A0A4Z1IPB6_9HELO|nr:hypothetical protein BCON_0053g00080 [Botryotinia convoluta]